MQSSTGQYSTQAGEQAQPVQHSVMTANSFGFFLRGVVSPFERGSCFNSSGTIPGFISDMAGIILYRPNAKCYLLGADFEGTCLSFCYIELPAPNSQDIPSI